jgi:hypothetical protein
VRRNDDSTAKMTSKRNGWKCKSDFSSKAINPFELQIQKTPGLKHGVGELRQWT